MKPSVAPLRKEGRYSTGKLAFFWLFVVVAALMAGCGKKGDPIPLRVPLPPAVSDLRAERTEGAIRLDWTAKISEGSVRVLRSVELSDEESCPDCPRNDEVINEMTVDDPELIRGDAKQKYSWIDREATGEKGYAYRVILCNERGFCGEPSNSAEVRKEKAGLPSSPSP